MDGSESPAGGRVCTARCTNVVELADFRAAPCTGLLRFAPGDLQAACDACGAWCGAEAADYISDLRARLLAAIGRKEHRAVVFHDLDEVPIGSVGYFSPSGKHARRAENGWYHEGWRFSPRLGPGQAFTSHSGPANDARLAELIEESLVPEHHVLASFRAEYDAESDWELGYEASWCDLVDAEVLDHRLSDDELAHLHFAVEQFGGLQEGDAFARLERQIDALGETAAEALRARAAQREAELPSWLRTDPEGRRTAPAPLSTEGDTP